MNITYSDLKHILEINLQDYAGNDDNALIEVIIQDIRAMSILNNELDKPISTLFTK